jgi:hypothetical protein
LFQQCRAGSDFYGLFAEPEYTSVSLDTHVYQCFGEYWNQQAEVPEGWGAHLDASCKHHEEVTTSFSVFMKINLHFHFLYRDKNLIRMYLFFNLNKIEINFVLFP